METLLRSFTRLQLLDNILKPSTNLLIVINRGKKLCIPRKRLSPWLQKPTRVLYDQQLTKENIEFLNEAVESRFGPVTTQLGVKPSPLKIAPIEPNTQWKPSMKRTGLIAKKIGIYPMWLKNGKKVNTTLLQIIDNQVIKYIPPEEHQPIIKPVLVRNKCGCLLVGAENIDPQLCTKEYYGLFKESGIMPKRMLARFFINPEAALEIGTPLYATHFKAGQIVDIRAKTVDRGFQGVMKRWGFKGMPASHGVTKTHRKPGNIGSGGGKARVMPGTKLPGHMGNRWRVLKGYRILRINTKYNVIWVLGHNIPGETNNFCYVYDTLLPLKKPTLENPPYFPTYLPGTEELPEELYADDVQPFDEKSIEFQQEK